MYNYHDKIRRIREAKDYKQEFMAAKLNISQRAYSSIENGQTQLTVERLFEIIKILDTSLPEVFEYEGGSVLHNNFNDTAIKSKLNAVSMPKFFEEIKGKGSKYYVS